MLVVSVYSCETHGQGTIDANFLLYPSVQLYKSVSLAQFKLSAANHVLFQIRNIHSARLLKESKLDVLNHFWIKKFRVTLIQHKIERFIFDWKRSKGQQTSTLAYLLYVNIVFVSRIYSRSKNRLFAVHIFFNSQQLLYLDSAVFLFLLEPNWEWLDALSSKPF